MSIAPIQATLELKQDEKVIIYALPYDFSEYSPYTANSYASAQWQSSILSGLFKRSSENERDWAPDLAVSMPSISEDLKTFNVTLKQGLIFSNGDSLTADDVIFSFKVAMTPLINTNFYGAFHGFLMNDSIVKLNDYEISINFLQQFAFPFGILSTPIIPEEIFESVYTSCIQGVATDCIWNNPEGTDIISAGPYKFSSYDSTNQIITVAKNDNYWGWDSETHANGNVDVIVFKKTTEKTAAIAELAAGHIQILDSQYVPGISELAVLTNIKEAFVGDPAHQEMSLNHLHPMWGTGEGIPGNEETNDAENLADALLVRRAMSHIMDREFAANEILEGLGQPAATTMPAAALGWDPTILPREYNISLARELMEQAGFDYDQLSDTDQDGVYETFFFEITVLSPNTSPARNEWSSVYVLDLPKIGIGVKDHFSTGWAELIIRTFGFPSGGYVPLFDDGGFDVFFVGYGWGLDWNPLGLYDSTTSHNGGRGPNFYNFDQLPSQLSDPSLTSDIEELVEEYLTTLDFSLRMQVLRELQLELHTYIPVVPIVYPQSHWGYDDVENIDWLLLSVSALEWENVISGVTLQTTIEITPEPITSSEDTTTTKPFETTSQSNQITPTSFHSSSSIISNTKAENISSTSVVNLTEISSNDQTKSEPVTFTSTAFNSNFPLPIILIFSTFLVARSINRNERTGLKLN